MKIIDLLNKIANGEEVPKSFEYHDFVYIWDEKRKAYFDDTNGICFGNNHLIDVCLNNEIEIIEEDKKIEKILTNDFEWNNYDDEKKVPTEVIYNLELIKQKVNEIIDKLNKEER